MKEIFADTNYTAFENSSSFDKNFKERLSDINEMLNSNIDFVNKVFQTRDNTKTQKQYGEDYVKFIRLYVKTVINFAMRLKRIIDKNIVLPSFILEMDSYSDEITDRLVNEIIIERKNLQLLELNLDIMFQNDERYKNELYSMYCNYIDSINMIRDKLIANPYSNNLK